MPALVDEATEKSTDAKKNDFPKEFIPLDDHSIHDTCDGRWERYCFRTEFDIYEKAAGCKNKYHDQDEGVAEALFTLMK